MPFYDYACDDCGPFTRLRPMAQAAEGCDCPDCGTIARRVIRNAPRLGRMDSARRSAHATNEQAASAPRLASRHGSGCSCCGSPGKARSSESAKSFPSKRPWMISH